MARYDGENGSRSSYDAGYDGRERRALSSVGGGSSSGSSEPRKHLGRGTELRSSSPRRRDHGSVRDYEPTQRHRSPPPHSDARRYGGDYHDDDRRRQRDYDRDRHSDRSRDYSRPSDSYRSRDRHYDGDVRDRRSPPRRDRDGLSSEPRDAKRRRGPESDSSDRRRTGSPEQHRQNGSTASAFKPTQASSLPSKPAFLAAAPDTSVTAATSAGTTPTVGSPASPFTPQSNAEDEKQRAKRERLEAWRKEREAKKAFEEARQRAQSVAAAHSVNGPGGNVVQPPAPSAATSINAAGLKGLSARFDTLKGKGTQSTSAMDDSDQPAKKQLKRFNLPPVDPLLKPGAGGKVGSGSDLEDDDDDGIDEGAVPAASASSTAMQIDGEAGNDKNDDDEEEDPLDAFMSTVATEVKDVNEADRKRLGINEPKIKAPVMGEDGEVEESAAPTGADDADELDQVGAEDIMALAAKKIKKKEMPTVDHSKTDYEPFRKDFYHPPTELEEMSEEDAERLRMELDAIKVRGKDCPKPLTKWSHCGLPASCLDVIRKLEYKAPTPIQSQAVPAIMSGRDIIGVAKTGSGKTMAFLLPMFRHIKDQRPVEKNEGPIGLIMTPTRELAVQIYRESKPFLRAMGLRAVCVYGGAPISEQIAEMKKTADIVVATPGRMIDLLTANQGRVTNLRRVSYLVLDEADRMFDMGFEPQVMKIVNNVRPDRQTVLFSATFPKQMESLARKVLRNKPIEITVGGRSVVAAEIEQIVEVREEESKFNRLLEILGQTYNVDGDSRTLIFVDRQEAADDLLRELIRKGYMTMSLHGGKDQVDRDATISDFKAGVVPIVTATSVAARGLDVKQLKLVINYDAPNHMEDYVHRAGRTGRAGNKGTCVTFITPGQDRYARDIIAALKASKVAVPTELQSLATAFQEKVTAGKAQAASSGFGGKGLERLEIDREKTLRAQRTAYGEGDEGAGAAAATADGQGQERPKQLDEIKVQRGPPPAEEHPQLDLHIEVRKGAAPESIRENKVKAEGEPDKPSSTAAPPPDSAADKNAAAIAAAKASGADAQKLASVLAKINAMAQQKKQQGRPTGDQANAQQPGGAPEKERKPKDPDATDYHAIVPINDFPQKARWRCTNKETMSMLISETGASITNKGIFYEKGKEPSPGEPPKLQLLIESNDEGKVEDAVRAIKQILLEATQAALEAEQRQQQGGAAAGSGSGAPVARYNVV
ncbi:unnamed protein product [Jaminaea pallidilutea]